MSGFDPKDLDLTAHRVASKQCVYCGAEIRYVPIPEVPGVPGATGGAFVVAHAKDCPKMAESEGE